MAQRVPARLTPAQGRKFGLTVGIAFLVLAGITGWRDHVTVATVLGTLGAALALAGLVAPMRLGPVERGWMAMAHAISRVTTPIVMGIVYFVVVAPIGFVMRLLGRNPLVRRASQGSFWINRDAAGRGAMDQQF